MGRGLHNVRIILVEPAGALNVGSVARVMKNMGLHQLVLVNPHCNPVGAEAQQMAVHAADLLETAQQVTSLPLALQGCQRAIATTGRTDAVPFQLESPRQALPWLLDAPSALIFGPEDRGLSTLELNQAQRHIQIPCDAAYVSLNLAQAVAVCCYELRQSVSGEAESASPSVPPIAPLDTLDAYLSHLERVLLRIGYLYPHTITSRMHKFRQMALRSQLTPSDLALLRGILRQIEWAAQAKSPDSPQKSN